jgi:hypothetical protein
MTVGATGFIAYLVSSNQAFFLGADSSVFFGFGEPQPGGPLTNGAVRGTYAGFTNDLATLSAGTFSGEFTTDGTSPRGNFTGTEDISNLSGPNSGVPFDATYAVSASPINGRGTITMTSGSGGSATMYVVSPSKFVVVPLSIPNPAIEIFKQ